MRIPFLGTAMRYGECIPVERATGARRRRRVLPRRLGRCTVAARCVFVEGTRSESGAAGGVQTRAVLPGDGDGRADMVPIAISGTEKMMRKHSAAVTPGVAKVQIRAYHPAGYSTRDELDARVAGRR